MAELKFAVEHELALTIGDLLVRRTPIAFETADHGRSAARELAPLASNWFGWTVSEAASACAEFDAEAERIFTIEPAPS